jgi:hypothetical protein
VYGTVRTVVWEDGGREAPSYPIIHNPFIEQDPRIKYYFSMIIDIIKFLTSANLLGMGSR